jgi:hypothetical protein
MISIHTPTILLAILSFLLVTSAQTQQPNGVIVPFTSVLPACASLCGKLFDVQGACSPPVLPTVSSTCFCGDPRLQPFLESGTAGVQSVCGPASCQNTTDLQIIQNWYETYCNIKIPGAATTSRSGAGPSTATASAATAAAAAAAANNTNAGWYVMALSPI